MKAEVKWIKEDDSFLVDGKKYTREEAKDLYDALDFHFEPIFIPSCWPANQATSVIGSTKSITTYTTGGNPQEYCTTNKKEKV